MEEEFISLQGKHCVKLSLRVSNRSLGTRIVGVLAGDTGYEEVCAATLGMDVEKKLTGRLTS